MNIDISMKEVENAIAEIIHKNTNITQFWSNSHGWAPKEAAGLISKSRLDWQEALSKTLTIWVKNPLQSGELILAWANLGALVEGTLKLLLSVYYMDYKNDIDRYVNRNGKLIEPDVISLELLKQFVRKKQILGKVEIAFIEKVQQRRNAIHAYRNREIGLTSEFHECLATYSSLIDTVDSFLPYPDF